MTKSKKILFVCVENIGRSQMAEGFLREMAPQFDVISAGTSPKPQLNPTVTEVMKEIGIDITKQEPKELKDEMIYSSITVNMGCMDKESCPSLFVKDVIDWNILDPKDKDIIQVRAIHDQIKNQVFNLIQKLEK
ncbi:MAG: arsenate reductase ArsC [Nitrosopumilus sp.]|nr:arsenate reductase ArsC [Nitrosopumilus sp.]